MRGKKAGSRGALNFFIIAAVIVALCVYFTLNAGWNAGTVVVIVILTVVDSFYFWLWRKYLS